MAELVLLFAATSDPGDGRAGLPGISQEPEPASTADVRSASGIRGCRLLLLLAMGGDSAIVDVALMLALLAAFASSPSLTRRAWCREMTTERRR